MVFLGTLEDHTLSDAPDQYPCTGQTPECLDGGFLPLRQGVMVFGSREAMTQ